MQDLNESSESEAGVRRNKLHMQRLRKIQRKTEKTDYIEAQD